MIGTLLLRAPHPPLRGCGYPSVLCTTGARIFIGILALAAISCDAQHDARRALDDARRLAAEGDYEAALEKHVWYHNNALATEPSQYGVRLSFALADWIKLGEKYPKALETLKSVRDTKTAKLIAAEGSRELFHDIASINEHLGEFNRTVDVFKRLDASDPEMAAGVYDVAAESLVRAREFELAKKYLANPSERLATAKRSFEEGTRWANSIDRGEGSRRAFEQIFADTVVRMIVVLSQTGDGETARVIQAEASKTLDNQKIRDAFPR